jgi:hypothetical protein
MTRYPEGNLLAGADLLDDWQIAENAPKTAGPIFISWKSIPYSGQRRRQTSLSGLPQWEPVPDCSLRA